MSRPTFFRSRDCMTPKIPHPPAFHAPLCRSGMNTHLDAVFIILLERWVREPLTPSKLGSRYSPGRTSVPPLGFAG